MSGSGKHGKSPGERPEKTSRHARGYAPYHRRLTFASRESALSVSASSMDVVSLSGMKSLHGGASGGQGHGSTAAADSPHSAAPSPLTATQVSVSVVNDSSYMRSCIRVS